MKKTCILEQIVVCKFFIFRDRLVTFLPSITLKRITLKTFKTMGKTSIIDIAVLKEKVQEYAMKVGRISARPVLLLYFVMVSKDTPKSDKLMILSTISIWCFR